MDEVRFVHREETFNDVAVRELAKSQAKCLCLLQFKRCFKDMCSNCASGQRIKNCKNCMSDYDRERLNNYTAEYYSIYSRNPMAWMSHKQFVRSYNRLVFGLIVFMFLILGSMGLGAL